MSSTERAAQFAPFAALTGYDDAVDEAARVVDKKIELSEDEKEELDRKIKEIQNSPNTEITVTYFTADKNKNGGIYRTTRGFIEKIDENERFIILSTKEKIPIDDIPNIDFN